MKCSNCGAPILDNSRFCSHCGAKIDDGVKRYEVNINKHIEDVAEIKRANYEEEESRLRQKKMATELKRSIIKRRICYSIMAIGFIPVLLMWIFNFTVGSFTGVLFGLFFLACLVLIFFIVQLIDGKW